MDIIDRISASPGERAIKAELQHLKINFVQQERIYGLKGDTKVFRDADFYLPDYDIYIEFLGNWNTNDEHKQRYNEKERVYRLNNVRCIWIKPGQLHYTNKVIQDGLLTYGIRFRQSTKNIQKNTIVKKSSFKKFAPLAIFIGLLIFSIFQVYAPRFSDSNDGSQIRDQKYEEIYSQLDIGMTSSKFSTLIFDNRLTWIPREGETTEFEVYGLEADPSRIKVYFDQIAQIEVPSDVMLRLSGGEDSSRAWIFTTGAKIIKIELYHNNRLISEK